jgi:hypothetical protein
MGPPLFPTGNKTWIGGFILRSAAFSGLPTLTEIEEENFERIFISDIEFISSTTL